MRKLAMELRGAGGLREGLTINQAADVLWATNSSELYVLLTVEQRVVSNPLRALAGRSLASPFVAVGRR